MSTACEDQCSPPKSRSNNSKAQEFHKGSNVSYTREVLLSLAELATCKRLPSRFDSSILCELKDASTGSSSTDIESGRSNVNLSGHLLVENGILGKGALLKEPGCVGGASAPRIQGNGYRLVKQDSGRWDTNLSQHLKRNPECGLLGKGAPLREHGCVTGVSAPMDQGCNYNLLNRSVTPYRPPHLYKVNIHPRREYKDIYTDKPFSPSERPCLEREEEERRRNDSFELMEKAYKANERKQKNVSDGHKGNLDSDIEDEKKSAGGISLDYKNDKSKASLASNENSDKHESKSFSLGRNASEVFIAANKIAYEHKSRSFSSQRSGVLQNLMVHSETEKISGQLCSSSTSIMPSVLEEIKQSVASEVTENHLTQHHHIQAYDTEFKKSNTAGHSGLSLHSLTLANKGIDERDPLAAPSKLNFSNSGNMGSILSSEPIQKADSTKKFHQKGSAARHTKYNLLGTINFPSPSDSEIIPLPVDKITRINHETPTPLGCVKQSGLNESNGEQSASSDVDNKIGLDSVIEQKLELNSVYGFDEEANAIDEICLPDEDSLITLDDLVFPCDLVLTADDNSTEGDLFASRTPDNDVHTPNSFNLRPSDEKSPSSLGNATLTSVNQVDSEPSYDNTRERSYPCSRKNPGRALFHHAEARSSNLMIYSCDPLQQSGFPINVLPDSCNNSFAEVTRFDSSVLRPVSQQVLFPCVFPHQLYGLHTGAPYNRPINEILGHSYSLNLTQNFAVNFPHQIFGGLEMCKSGHDTLWDGTRNKGASFVSQSRNI